MWALEMCSKKYIRIPLFVLELPSSFARFEALQEHYVASRRQTTEYWSGIHIYKQFNYFSKIEAENGHLTLSALQENPNDYNFFILYLLQPNVVFVFWRSQVQISAQKPTVLTEGLRGFSQSIQANPEIVPSFRPRPLPCLSFSVYHSLVISSLDAIYSLDAYVHRFCVVIA
jgi:hypothetical protein